MKYGAPEQADDAPEQKVEREDAVSCRGMDVLEPEDSQFIEEPKSVNAYKDIDISKIYVGSYILSAASGYCKGDLGCS